MPHCASWVSRPCQILEARVVEYLDKQPPERHVETHEIPRIRGDDFHVLPTNVLSCSAHGWFDGFPRCIHQQFAEPFEDLLNLLWIGLVKVL